MNKNNIGEYFKALKDVIPNVLKSVTESDNKNAEFKKNIYDNIADTRKTVIQEKLNLLRTADSPEEVEKRLDDLCEDADRFVEENKAFINQLNNKDEKLFQLFAAIIVACMTPLLKNAKIGKNIGAKLIENTPNLIKLLPFIK